MIYMPDALRACVELMETDPAKLVHRNSFNIASMSFTPEIISAEIRKRLPDFAMDYDVDPVKKEIAELARFARRHLRPRGVGLETRVGPLAHDRRHAGAYPHEAGRVERYDADVRVGQDGAVVEPLGIVILYVEVHGPCDPFVHRAVECFDPLAFGRVAEEHRVGEYVVGRAQFGETFVFGEEVDRQKIAVPPHLFQQVRQFFCQRRAVAQYGHRRGWGPHRACPADIVAEILFTAIARK